jgi:hypothetical protein
MSIPRSKIGMLRSARLASGSPRFRDSDARGGTGSGPHDNGITDGHTAPGVARAAAGSPNRAACLPVTALTITVDLGDDSALE